MKWLVSNWNELISVPWNFVTLAVVAVLCGAIVGIERDKKEKPVGFRTLTLVSLGSAVFTMMSVVVDPEHGDPTRIAAQVVTGIGFLGAGVILRGRFGVTGLTSAATIWIMAATGMVIGFGYGGAGIFLSILVLTVITLIAALGRQYVGPCDYGTCVVRFASSGGKTAILLEEILDEYDAAARDCQLAIKENGNAELRLRYCSIHRNHRAFLVRFAELPEVTAIIRDAA